MSLVTFQGVHFTVRDGTSDWNTVAACVEHDEYGLGNEDVRGKLVFDVGAHIGGVGVWLATRGAYVVCIEPVPGNADMVRQNAALNDVRLEVEEAAAGPAGGTTVVRFGRAHDENDRVHAWIGNTGLPFEADADFKQVGVPTVSLAEMVEKYGAPDIVKIDCEGGEWSWLAETEIKDVPLISGEWHSMPWLGDVYGRADVYDAFTHYGRETHTLTFTGPEGGPGGFRAERL